MAVGRQAPGRGGQARLGLCLPQTRPSTLSRMDLYNRVSLGERLLHLVLVRQLPFLCPLFSPLDPVRVPVLFLLFLLHPLPEECVVYSH